MKLIPMRRIRYELRNIRLKYVVKILMSKNEILQSDKMDKEIKTIYENAYGLEKINKDMAIYRNFLKRVSQF